MSSPSSFHETRLQFKLHLLQSDSLKEYVNNYKKAHPKSEYTFRIDVWTKVVNGTAKPSATKSGKSCLQFMKSHLEDYFANPIETTGIRTVGFMPKQNDESVSIIDSDGFVRNVLPMIENQFAVEDGGDIFCRYGKSCRQLLDDPDVVKTMARTFLKNLKESAENKQAIMLMGSEAHFGFKILYQFWIDNPNVDLFNLTDTEVAKLKEKLIGSNGVKQNKGRWWSSRYLLSDIKSVMCGVKVYSILHPSGQNNTHKLRREQQIHKMLQDLKGIGSD